MPGITRLLRREHAPSAGCSGKGLTPGDNGCPLLCLFISLSPVGSSRLSALPVSVRAGRLAGVRSPPRRLVRDVAPPFFLYNLEVLFLQVIFKQHKIFLDLQYNF